MNKIPLTHNKQHGNNILMSSFKWDSKSGEKKQRAPIDTISTFGHTDRVGKTNHWGLSNLLTRGTNRSNSRNSTNSIPSSLSSKKNMIMEQPMLQRRVKMIACSQKTTIALLIGGEMYSWGEANNTNSNKNTGGVSSSYQSEESFDTNEKSLWPTKIDFNKEVIFVAAGHDHFAALTVETKNNLYTWGDNKSGQLGHGDKKNKKTPRKIISWKKRKEGTRDYGETLSQYVTDDVSEIRIVHVACAYKFTIAVSDNNRMFGWGKNKNGQLGLSAAVKRDDQMLRGPESAKRRAVFQQVEVLWPVELVEMNELGYNKNTIVNDHDQVKLAQLMIAVGTQHSTSWMHSESLNMFSEAYRQEHESMKKRIEQLENDALKHALERNGSGGNGGIGNGNQNGNEKGDETNSNFNSSTTRADFIATIPRRVTDDPTLNATGRLLAELHTDLLSCQSELLETKKEITNSDSSKSLQQNGLEKQEMNVKNLWKMVEILEYDSQILQQNIEKQLKKEDDEYKEKQKGSHTKNKKKKRKQSPIILKLTQLIDAKTIEANDKKSLALNGKAKLTEEHLQLTSLGEENIRLGEKRERLEAKCKALENKVVLLNKLYIGHDKLIRRTYINHHKQDVFDLASIARTLFQKIRISDVAGLAANANLVNKMARNIGHQPGVDDLIAESNRRLVETMIEAENYLDRRIGVTDARRELADLLKEALNDMTKLRRQNNTYVAGILSQASSKLEL